MRKKIKGFTLVELIVVIAIIGVLAGLMVPSMIGSLKRAKMNSSNSNARSIFKSAQTVMQQYEFRRDPDFKVNGTIYSTRVSDSQGGSNGSALADDVNVNKFRSDLKRYFADADSAAWIIYVDNYIVYRVVAANSASDIYVGAYPSPPSATSTGLNSKGLSTYSDSDVLTDLAPELQPT